MSTNGAVSVQGSALRIATLNSDGSINSTTISGPSLWTSGGQPAGGLMYQDDRAFVKLEAKPEMEAGTQFVPRSAAGVPVIAFRDFDRYKWWSVNITLGDWDPEAKQLLSQESALMMSPGSAGRTFDDAVFNPNSNVLTSASLGDFTTADVGRSVVSNQVPAGTFVQEYVSPTTLRMSQPANSVGNSSGPSGAGPTVPAIIATGTPTTSSPYTSLGAIASSPVGYNYPHLLLVPGKPGVAIEVWSKLITRGTGWQGTTPYQSAGQAPAAGAGGVGVPPSGYLRTGLFRCYLYHDAFSIENKERETSFSGWAIENPNFGTGPNDDWRYGAVPSAGIPVDTTTTVAEMADFELPSGLMPGAQVTA